MAWRSCLAICAVVWVADAVGTGAAPIASFGHGDRVTVDACVPAVGCHVGLVQMLYRLADAYPDDLSVRVYELHSPEGAQAIGATCAGYAVNGSTEFTYSRADGSGRTAVFLKSTEMGTYTAGELCAAVLARLEEAGVEVPGDPLDAVDPAVWPNQISAANSDPWLVANHDRLRVMEPRVLVLNFANAYDAAKVEDIVTKYAAAIAEGSRYHGYANPEAPTFLRYRVVRIVDLRDNPIPSGRESRNSRYWPRDTTVKGAVDYSRFFAPEMTELIDFRSPAEPERALSIEELVELGLINELWFIGSHNDEDAAFEAVELKQVYDDRLQPVEGEYRQAGNGGDDRQPWTGRSFRITWINPDRGIGCALENICHAMEAMSSSGAIPYFTRYFREYAGFDLDERYGLPANCFYACPYGGPDPIEWLGPTTIRVTMAGRDWEVENYIPAGGNVHFPPNARRHYDLSSPVSVLSTIRSFRMRNGPDGKDMAEEWTVAEFARYAQTAPDCMGPWLVYWRQNMPGLDNLALDDRGGPMKNWWPFLFY